MWISVRDRALPVQEAEAEVGTVTLGGDPAAVLVGGERRTLPVYAPGGYNWRPVPGDKVLVLKAGAEREEPCIVGSIQKGGSGLAPGEICLSRGASSVRLGPSGLMLTSDRIMVNGKTLEEYVKKIVIQVLYGGSEGGEGGGS